MLFSLRMLLIDDSPPPPGGFSTLLVVCHFGCYSVLFAGQELNLDGAFACTDAVRSCALVPGHVLFYISFNYCQQYF